MNECQSWRLGRSRPPRFWPGGRGGRRLGRGGRGRVVKYYCTLSCIVLYCILLYSIALYCIVLYLSISIALLTACAFQKRSRPQQLTLCRSLNTEALHATVNEGFVQGPDVSVRAGFEPATLRSNSIDSTNVPTRPTEVYEKLDESRAVDVVNIPGFKKTHLPRFPVQAWEKSKDESERSWKDSAYRWMQKLVELYKMQ